MNNLEKEFIAWIKKHSCTQKAIMNLSRGLARYLYEDYMHSNPDYVVHVENMMIKLPINIMGRINSRFKKEKKIERKIVFRRGRVQIKIPLEELIFIAKKITCRYPYNKLSVYELGWYEFIRDFWIDENYVTKFTSLPRFIKFLKETPRYHIYKILNRLKDTK